MTTRILATVALERVRQHIEHGDQRHLPDGTGPLWTETTDDARRALSGWCACRQHSGRQSRPHIAHRCGCTCHGKDQQ